MEPDFAAPAFSFFALGRVRFFAASEGGVTGPIQSNLRCQLRVSARGDEPMVDVRVYLVGNSSADIDVETSVILAFLDWKSAAKWCVSGVQFELCMGRRAIASGTVARTGGELQPSP
jgi:hypothetical protein